jgi:MFS family permease
MAFIDGSALNVALPAIGADLGASVAQTQWVVNAYALLLAALVLVGGSAGDRFGRRRAFVAGVVLFTVASVACGLAPSADALVAARAVQGVGAALLVPGSLALIGAAFAGRSGGAPSAPGRVRAPSPPRSGRCWVGGWSTWSPGARSSSSTCRSPWPPC